jgi:hypothetical protein
MQFLWHKLGEFVLLSAVFAVFWLVASLKLWPQWLRRVKSASWSTASGTVEGGEVSVLHSFDRGFAREVATCTLNYSYRVNGDYTAAFIPGSSSTSRPLMTSSVP